MLTYIRYLLATVCFAASIGCLALWWRIPDQDNLEYQLRYDFKSRSVVIGLSHFNMTASWAPRSESRPAHPGLYTKTMEVSSGLVKVIHERVRKQGAFGSTQLGVYFPLWYPALIFALAGVGVLRFRRQFSIRSALVCLTAVAALLGMAVVL